MNIVSFHKQDLQLVIQYLSIARITRLSEEPRFFSANPSFSYKGGCGVREHTRIEEFKRRAGLGCR